MAEMPIRHRRLNRNPSLPYTTQTNRHGHIIHSRHRTIYYGFNTHRILWTTDAERERLASRYTNTELIDYFLTIQLPLAQVIIAVLKLLHSVYEVKVPAF